jgi:hypothetical protein
MAASVFATARTPKARFSGLRRTNGTHSSEECETENSIASAKYDRHGQDAVAAKAPRGAEGPSRSPGSGGLGLAIASRVQPESRSAETRSWRLTRSRVNTSRDQRGSCGNSGQRSAREHGHPPADVRSHGLGLRCCAPAMPAPRRRGCLMRELARESCASRGRKPPRSRVRGERCPPIRWSAFWHAGTTYESSSRRSPQGCLAPRLG